ncbi:2'-5' RNA ligase family protein [Propionibacteriaceae bacterium Y2011]
MDESPLDRTSVSHKPMTVVQPAVRDDLTVEGRTALIVPLDAGPVVDRWRLATDPTAPGVPAHVTVLVPFLELDRIDDSVTDWLSRLCAGIVAPEITLDDVRSFPTAVWLHPAESDFFVDLTTRVAARWPDHPPYEGQHAEVVPHLTVAHAPRMRDRVAAELAPTLPIRRRVDGVHLFAYTRGSWIDVRQFPFAG